MLSFALRQVTRVSVNENNFASLFPPLYILEGLCGYGEALASLTSAVATATVVEGLSCRKQLEKHVQFTLLQQFVATCLLNHP